MSTLAPPQGPRAASAAAGDGFDAGLERLEPITLAGLNDQARLMTRVDRKYFVPRSVFTDLLDRTGEGFRVLQIDGVRRFRYRTVYFDTPDFAFFRQHAQGRRRRYKVRTRTYCETGDAQLEVKSKGYRGRTVKERIDHDPAAARTLDATGRAFAAGIVGPDAHRLEPVVETIYHRITLSRAEQRVTCDLDLRFIEGTERHDGPGDVLLETKSAGERGLWDELLRHAGIRTHSVSKYCVATSLIYPDLPSNPWHRTIRRYFPRRG